MNTGITTASNTGRADKKHTMKRKTVAGVVREYDYKLFRVLGPSGRVTTVSVDWQVYFRLLKRYALGPRAFSLSVKSCAARLIEARSVSPTVSFSEQVRTAVREHLEQRSLTRWN